MQHYSHLLRYMQHSVQAAGAGDDPGIKKGCFKLFPTKKHAKPIRLAGDGFGEAFVQNERLTRLIALEFAEDWRIHSLFGLSTGLRRADAFVPDER